MNESITLVSKHKYKVLKVLKKSKARYAEGIVKGDSIHLEMAFSSTKGASGNGRYTLYFNVYANDKLVGKASQIEVLNLFLKGVDSILSVEQEEE
ncbi:hypothetical protein [Enterococcus dongliensis]|uniref:Uncharacterized protein n=1 Tax=Enterococcus dongliensis TaxID=2559925 RepID=A0ABU3EQ95_9ENTE|nr:hypothetical protein [Enterococcus dongliensis]MDT2597027.1 hypothetical protein [Enterococcus dongliensis]